MKHKLPLCSYNFCSYPMTSGRQSGRVCRTPCPTFFWVTTRRHNTRHRRSGRFESHFRKGSRLAARRPSGPCRRRRTVGARTPTRTSPRFPGRRGLSSILARSPTLLSADDTFGNLTQGRAKLGPKRLPSPLCLEFQG